MSTQKSTAKVNQNEKSEIPTKKMKNDPTTNNNVDGMEKVHADEQVPIDIKTVKSCKLPAEVLQKFHNEPGKLLIAGNVEWDTVGGKPGQRKELTTFHRFTDQKYRAIFSSSSSSHNLLINMDWKVFSFGRNQSGQCGHEQLCTFYTPQSIVGLSHLNIVQAAASAKHSLFLTDEGTVYACGDNKNGQLGIGTRYAKRKFITKPRKIDYNGAPIVQIGCGDEFSAILDIDGNLYTFGLPEFGQLGHGTDGKYFITSSRLAFDTVHSPKLVSSFIEKTKEGHSLPVTNVKIVNFACGRKHTIAIDAEKRAFSFGFGGYGRLGHNEQVDEWTPRLIKYLNPRVTGGAVRAFCGATFSIAISGHNNPYLFGRNKNTAGANAQMYPKVVDALCGFKLKSIGCSCTSIVLACEEKKLIAWGASPTYGELGIGENPKSSTMPTFLEYMDGVIVSQVTMGWEHTLLLVNIDDTISNQKYHSQPEYAPADQKSTN